MGTGIKKKRSLEFIICRFPRSLRLILVSKSEKKESKDKKETARYSSQGLRKGIKADMGKGGVCGQGSG